jgi:hypothetical protein
MSHGFTYSAGCGKQEPQAQQGHGAEMALARAERRALHRAFNIPTSGGDWDDDPPEVYSSPVTHSTGGEAAREVGSTPSPAPSPPEGAVPRMTHGQSTTLADYLEQLGLMGQAMRGPRMAYISDVLGRDVGDTRTITYAEAELLLQAMREAARALDVEPDVIEPEPEPEPEEGDQP